MIDYLTLLRINDPFAYEFKAEDKEPQHNDKGETAKKNDQTDINAAFKREIVI